MQGCSTDTYLTTCSNKHRYKQARASKELAKISDKGEAVTKESENKSDALQSAIFCDQSIISSQGDSNSDNEDKHIKT